MKLALIAWKGADMSYVQTASAASAPARPSRASLRAGRIVTGAVALFLLFDAVIHLLGIPPVVEAFARLDFPMSAAAALGALELLCLAAYLVPRTAPIGAILLTGYLGGAVAIQLRAGSSFFGETLFPVYLGILAWAGLILRDRRVWSLLASRG